MLQRVLFAVVIVLSSQGFAASGQTGVGVSAGIGFPYLTQFGLNYKLSDKISFSGQYGLLDIKVGDASAKLGMPELMVNYHVFAQAFFVGLGVGQQTLAVKATEATTNNQVAIDVESMSAIAKLGWMWGISDGGFWFGVDVAYIMPMSPKTTITAPGVPTTDPDYIDAQEAADRFGKSSYFNITFIRLGYLF